MSMHTYRAKRHTYFKPNFDSILLFVNDSNLKRTCNIKEETILLYAWCKPYLFCLSPDALVSFGNAQPQRQWLATHRNCLLACCVSIEYLKRSCWDFSFTTFAYVRQNSLLIEVVFWYEWKITTTNLHSYFLYRKLNNSIIFPLKKYPSNCLFCHISDLQT